MNHDSSYALREYSQRLVALVSDNLLRSDEFVSFISASLYHVGGGDTPYANDAAERVNLAAKQPERVAAMVARLAQYEETAWSGEAVVADTGGACDRALANGGVLGPWQAVPTLA